MEEWVLWLICAVVGYLIGNVQFAVIISRLKYKDDVRNHGSGNAGSTNMLRVFGLKSGLITFAGDVLKGVLGVLLGRWIAGEAGGCIAAIFVVLGHDFPVFLGFRGGKGVATSLGVILVAHTLFSLAVILTAVVSVAITKMISVASLAGATVFLLLVLIFEWGNWPLLILTLVLWGMIVIRHRENIGRLIKGEESKVSFKKKKENNGTSA